LENEGKQDGKRRVNSEGAKNVHKPKSVQSLPETQKFIVHHSNWLKNDWRLVMK